MKPTVVDGWHEVFRMRRNVKRNVFQAAVEKVVGVTGKQVSRHESGEVETQVGSFAALLDLYGVRDFSQLARAFSGAVAGIRGYRCEDASIPTMTISAERSGKGVRTVTVSGMLLVGESYDRAISLEFTLRDEDGPILARGRQNNIPVEEKKSNRFSVKLVAEGEKLAAIDAAKSLTLGLTMHVRRDGATPWKPMEKPQ